MGDGWRMEDEEFEIGIIEGGGRGFNIIKFEYKKSV